VLALFLDESGDHNLDKIDPEYPVFVLGGCIIDLKYHDEVLSSKVSKYKKDLFGRDDFILHTADIVRRRGVFRSLTDRNFREQFYLKTNQLMEDLEYLVVACCIRKDKHLAQYGLAALDPYMLSLRILVERFVFEIKKTDAETPGIIVAESRDETLDNELRLAWMDLRTTGTGYVSASEIRRHISELHIRNKTSRIAGLQIADLIVSPIGRHLLGKRAKQDWRILEKKFRCNAEGRYMGYGLVVLPKKEKAAPE